MTNKEATNKDWSRSEKMNARKATVIEFYKEWSGRQTLPSNLFYWTLCGKLANAGDLAGKNVEFEHVVSINPIITADQWVGVERGEEDGIKEIEKLKQAYAGRGNWLDGEFFDCFADNYNRYPPGIVNLDTTTYYKNGLELAGDILMLLSEISYECMVVVNVSRGNRYFKGGHTIVDGKVHIMTTDEAAEMIKKSNRCIRAACALEDGWNLNKKCYEYGGTGNSASEFNTWIFVKPPKM
jgi:hypothetical protein